MDTEDGSAPRRSALRADVCVVGAGPAGLTLALELGRAGLQVLLLEAGPADPPEDGVDVTSTRSVGLAYPPESTRSAGVGGSALRWSVQTPLGGGFVRLRELDAADFGSRPYVAGTAWPFGRDVLDPWYRQARELIGLPTGDDEESDAGGGLERRTYAFTHRSVFTHDLPARVRADARVELVPGCTVTEVVTDAGSGRVSRLHAVSQSHGLVQVRADAYVLAGGGLENPRLLLASRAASPAGVGNAHDHVGRHFMEHPHYVSGVVLPHDGPGGLPAEAWDVVVRDGRPEQTKYVLAEDLLRREGLLAAVYKVKADLRTGPPGFGHDGDVPQRTVDAYLAATAAVRRREARLLSPADGGQLLRATPRLLRFAVDQLGRRDRRPPSLAHHVRVMSEQEPSPASRLRLTGTPDRFGVPTAELDWRLTDLDVRTMVEGQRRVADALGRAVGGSVVSTLGPGVPPRLEGGAHHMGTTRMSVRPQDGVVDADCRVHGVGNLYVAGSSVFPTGGAANPTLTVLALALRLAGHLRSELAPPSR